MFRGCIKGSQMRVSRGGPLLLEEEPGDPEVRGGPEEKMGLGDREGRDLQTKRSKLKPHRNVSGFQAPFRLANRVGAKMEYAGS